MTPEPDPVSPPSPLRASISTCLMVALAAGLAGAMQRLEVGAFSTMDAGGLPTGWTPLRFPSVERDTDYALVEHEGVVVLQGNSRRAASALVTRISVDASRLPYLSWSWKAGEGCVAGSWRQPDTDDFPLRLFVLFEQGGGLLGFFRRLGSGLSGDVVLYLGRASTADEGTRTSHLSGRIRVVPLPGEAAELSWDRPVRNVRRDYVELFGREPRRVTGIAVMVDTDNSGTECVSYFGDIRFLAQTP